MFQTGAGGARFYLHRPESFHKHRLPFGNKIVHGCIHLIRDDFFSPWGILI
jgi:hypothetical protein